MSRRRGTTTYQYDALGYLVSETVNGQTTHNLIDPTGLGSVIAQFNTAGNVVAQYTYGAGLVSQITPAGSSEYYAFDANGNTTQLTGPGGTLLDTYSYLPFGDAQSASGSAPNPFTFAAKSGAVTDASGFVFMRNRWYDTGVGRFTEPDPSGLVGGSINLYAYALNNPLVYTDPLGLMVGKLDGRRRTGRRRKRRVQTLGEDGGVFHLRLVVRAEPPVWGRRSALPTRTLGAGDATRTRVRQFSARVMAGNDGSGRTTNFVGLPNSSPGDYTGVVLTEGVGIGTGKQYTTKPAHVLGRHASVTYRTHRTDFTTKSAISSTRPATVAFCSPARSAASHSRLMSLEPCKKPASTSAWSTERFVLVPASHDPNELIGPAGVGTQGFLQPIGPLPYRIDFTNEPSATAPAATVVVTDQLSPNLDLSTFQLGEIGFGSTVVQVPAGLTSYSTEVTLPSIRPRGRAGRPDRATSPPRLIRQPALVTWTFTSLDPATLDVPINPLEGFLPPDDSEGDGEGFVTYTIEPKSSATTGTVINAQATVVFDTNPPISTAIGLQYHRRDGADELGQAAAGNHDQPSFTVSWSGSDGAGSGIASYNVFVSTNGGPFGVSDRHDRNLGDLHRPGRPHLRVLQRGHQQRRPGSADADVRPGNDHRGERNPAATTSAAAAYRR